MGNNIEEGYYFINNSKKMCYYNKGYWYKPAFDPRKKLCGYYPTPLTINIKSYRELNEWERKLYICP